MGKEGRRGDSRVYGGLGLGSDAKAHPGQYVVIFFLMIFFLKKFDD